MSDLLPYNIRYVSHAQGMQNFGNKCYMNSIWQSLLSCPAILETLEKNKDAAHIKNNSIAQQLLKLSELTLSRGNITLVCNQIWNNVLDISLRRKDSILMSHHGQQDAHEGLLMFLAVTESIPEIQRLFTHRHRHRILCHICEKWIVDKFEDNVVLEVQPDLKTEHFDASRTVSPASNLAGNLSSNLASSINTPADSKVSDTTTADSKAAADYANTTMSLNDFLRIQNGFVDSDYICTTCKVTTPRFKITTLSMVPEILPIVLKKYANKPITPFPIQLEFTVRGGQKKLIYALVSQSEHSGGINGGHYWAISLRKDQNNKLAWKLLNDSAVADGRAGPTAYSYIIFYCFVRMEDIEYSSAASVASAGSAGSSTTASSTPITDINDNRILHAISKNDLSSLSASIGSLLKYKASNPTANPNNPT